MTPVAGLLPILIFSAFLKIYGAQFRWEVTRSIEGGQATMADLYTAADNEMYKETVALAEGSRKFLFDTLTRATEKGVR